jgi:hypothetical protein
MNKRKNGKCKTRITVPASTITSFGFFSVSCLFQFVLEQNINNPKNIITIDRILAQPSIRELLSSGKKKKRIIFRSSNLYFILLEIFLPFLCHNTSSSSNSIKSNIVFAQDKYTKERNSERECVSPCISNIYLRKRGCVREIDYDREIVSPCKCVC